MEFHYMRFTILTLLIYVFVTGGPPDVLCRGLTTCPLHVGPRFDKAIRNDLIWKFDTMVDSASLFCAYNYW